MFRNVHFQLPGTFRKVWMSSGRASYSRYNLRKMSFRRGRVCWEAEMTLLWSE